MLELATTQLSGHRVEADLAWEATETGGEPFPGWAP